MALYMRIYARVSAVALLACSCSVVRIRESVRAHFRCCSNGPVLYGALVFTNKLVFHDIEVRALHVVLVPCLVVQRRD